MPEREKEEEQKYEIEREEIERGGRNGREKYRRNRHGGGRGGGVEGIENRVKQHRRRCDIKELKENIMLYFFRKGGD